MTRQRQDYSQDRRAVWSWMSYDWANSAFSTTVMAGFFPIFFKSYLSQGVDVTVSTAQLGIANVVGSLLVSVSAPILGAISDAGAYKKKLLGLFCFLGVIMTASLALLQSGQWMWAVAIYALANLGHAGSTGFYDSLLPLVATQKNIDRVSSLGFAWGYLGGGLLFALNVLMYQKPDLFGILGPVQAVQWSFVSVAVWWALFTIPIMLFVKEPKSIGQKRKLKQNVKKGLWDLQATLKELRKHKMVVIFLIAFFLYNDAVGTTIKMAVDYGLSIGFGTSDLILALLLVQFVGFPAAIGFGYLGQKTHPKTGIYIAIGVYIFAVGWAYQMQEAWEFYLLACFIGCVQGGVQALSRSYYSRLFH